MDSPSGDVLLHVIYVPGFVMIMILSIPAEKFSFSRWNLRPFVNVKLFSLNAWRRHQMETISSLLALCAWNSPVNGEFPSQRPATRSLGVFFDLRPNKRLSKQSWCWWFETLSCPLWRQRNVYMVWPLTTNIGVTRVIQSMVTTGEFFKTGIILCMRR